MRWQGDNAASNNKKARFCSKNYFNCAEYGLDPVLDLDLKPKLFQSRNRNRNRNQWLRFQNFAQKPPNMLILLIWNFQKKISGIWHSQFRRLDSDTGIPKKSWIRADHVLRLLPKNLSIISYLTHSVVQILLAGKERRPLDHSGSIRRTGSPQRTDGKHSPHSPLPPNSPPTLTLGIVTHLPYRYTRGKA